MMASQGATVELKGVWSVLVGKILGVLWSPEFFVFHSSAVYKVFALQCCHVWKRVIAGQPEQVQSATSFGRQCPQLS